MHNDCTITFKPGLAAIRSLYRFDRLPPALHGVKQFDNCISAWPYGQAHAFYPFWPAHRPHCAARQYASTIAIDVQHMPHHDCFQINLRSAIAVCPQRLHHCASAWPCGQALSLSFCFAAKRSLYSFRPTYRPRCAARQYALIIAIAPRSAYVVGRISIVFKLPCYLQLLCVHSDCQ